MGPVARYPVPMTEVHGQIIDGKALAATVRASLKERVRRLVEAGVSPRLDAVIAAHDGPGVVYAQNQARHCEEISMAYTLHSLDPDASQESIEAKITELNGDDAVQAIMVHLPLPSGVETERIQSMIDSVKDVEAVNPVNIGNIVYGRRSLVPCTALATMALIESTGIDLQGAVVVCVGASNIVGKPLAVLLMRAHATVVSTNIHTTEIESWTQRADVLISAAGVPGLISPEMVKPGAVVIDVGINRVTDPETGKRRTVGDLQFDAVRDVAGFLSPVPGGVGPMTVAMLLRNTVDAWELRGGF
jgi:methylenetetrahydrofolate dehydrogenase (NADP+)/methenyltetrahydrofolate cyclohydrolase